MRFAIVVPFLLIMVRTSERKPKLLSERRNEISSSHPTLYSVAESFETEYSKYTETGLKKLWRMLEPPNEIRTQELESLSKPQQESTCKICHSFVLVLFKMRRGGKDPAILRALVLKFCIENGIQSRVVCEGVMDKMLKVLLFIVDNRPTLSAVSVCSVILQASGCVNDDPEFDWHVGITPPVKNIAITKSFFPVSGADNLKIVHLSDIHYDPEYKMGSLANCKLPMCCRSTENNLSDDSDAAGSWGDYRNCDSPLTLVENTLDAVLGEHSDIDYVYYTGDYVDHAVWSTSVTSNKKTIYAVDALLKNKFKNTPVFPVIGNHESDPVNIFAPEYIKTNGLESGWIYNFLANEWSMWLPNAAQDTIRKGGYYTVSPRRGFRVIAINNNDCYTYNFWLLFDPNYLKIQLQWLQDTLFQAEQAGEFVHILSHIPSGVGGCHFTWSREFRRIIDRYHNIIGGIFNGHTHRDNFSVYYLRSNISVPINVAWNGGSVTPYTNVNPNYRVYGVETKTYQVVHHETWIMNLTLSNMNPERSPSWIKEYSFVNAYGVPDLSLASLDQLLYKFALDKDLLRKYWSFHVKLGDPSIKAGCNTHCLQQLLCDMATTQGNDLAKCKELIQIFSVAHSG